MPSSSSTFVSALMASLATAKTIAQINVYNSGDCHNYIQQYSLGDYGQDGACY